MHKLIMLAILVIASFFPTKTIFAETTTVFVYPQVTRVQAGETFEINISIAQVSDLAAWEFKLYYESSLLNATTIVEGPFLRSAGITQFVVFNFTDSYNATHGRIWAACTLTGQGPGAGGNGILASITFNARAIGRANLQLRDTDLLDSKMPPDRISHATIDGTVEIGGRDIAVIYLTASKTVVGQGFSMFLNVTLENQGSITETFNVNLFADIAVPPIGDEVLIGTLLVNNLLAREVRTTTYTFDNVDVAKGIYTISAVAEALPGETETIDNTFVDGTFRVSIPCDVAGSTTTPPAPPDGRVNYVDVFWLLKAYGSDPTKPNWVWNTNLDFAGSTTTPPTPPDNKVNYIDVFWLLIYYGSTDP